MSVITPLWQWVITVGGVRPSSSPNWYNFWSGIGSDFGELTIFAAVMGLYHKHNCHVTGCWRIGKYKVAGSHYVVCKVHHPSVPDAVTAEHIQAVHDQALS